MIKDISLCFNISFAESNGRSLSLYFILWLCFEAVLLLIDATVFCCAADLQLDARLRRLNFSLRLSPFISPSLAYLSCQLLLAARQHLHASAEFREQVTVCTPHNPEPAFTPKLTRTSGRWRRCCERRHLMLKRQNVQKKEIITFIKSNLLSSPYSRPETCCLFHRNPRKSKQIKTEIHQDFYFKKKKSLPSALPPTIPVRRQKKHKAVKKKKE